MVLEIDPRFKREFYAALSMDGLTAKDWFLQQAARYIEEQTQPALFAQDKPVSSAERKELKTTG